MHCNHLRALFGAVLLFAPAVHAADAPPKPLTLIKQMDAAMRNFGPGTVDIHEMMHVYRGGSSGKLTFHLKMNGWTDYIETTQSDDMTITHYESRRGTVRFTAGNKWFYRDNLPSHQPPFALAAMFPPGARPDGWWRPVAKPVLDATRVVAAEYQAEPAWRIEFPVDTMREQVAGLTMSLFVPPIRAITVGRDDHLPRAWTGLEVKDPSHAAYMWRRAPRLYTLAEMSFHPAPGLLEVGSRSVNDRTIAVVKGNAPDFSLKSVLGHAPVQLSHLRGRLVLLILKANRAALETALRFYRDFHGKRLAVLVVTADTPAAVRKALPKGGVPFPVLADKDGNVSTPYAIGGADMVLVGKDGAVRAAGKIGRDLPRFRSVVKAMP